ncbi:microcompartment protein PduM [Brevibacillus daliensis]|uniref:microcompartment protein PduM n=1 Tax=Brevibacillus daliensis TaxID=2892995 RepID=UPI0035A19AFB
MVYVPKRVICFQNVVILPDHSCLVTDTWQMITPLAKETLVKKNMMQLERL